MNAIVTCEMKPCWQYFDLLHPQFASFADGFAKSRNHGTLLAGRNRVVVPAIPGKTAFGRNSDMKNEPCCQYLGVSNGYELRDRTRRDPFILLFNIESVSADRHVIRRISTLRPEETAFDFRSLSTGEKEG